MKNNKRTIFALSALAAATMACRFGIPIPTIANPYNVTFGSQQSVVTQQSGACVQPTATSGYVEPTATQGCLQPTPTSTQVPPTSTPVYTPTTPSYTPTLDSCLGSVEECQQNVLGTLFAPISGEWGPQQYVCSIDASKGQDFTEENISDAFVLSQQRLTQLGLYTELREQLYDIFRAEFDSPDKVAIYRAIFDVDESNPSNPSYKMLVHFGDGETSSMAVKQLTEDEMKAYYNKTGGYSIESIVRDKETFLGDMQKNGTYSLNDLAVALTQPDVKGYTIYPGGYRITEEGNTALDGSMAQTDFTLEKLVEILGNNDLIIAYAPNKIPCANGADPKPRVSITVLDKENCTRAEYEFELPDAKMDALMEYIHPNYGL